MFDLIRNKKVLIVGGCLLVLLISFVVIYYFNDYDKEITGSGLVIKEPTKESVDNLYVDVKGDSS